MLTVTMLKVLMLSHFNKHHCRCETRLALWVARDHFRVAHATPCHPSRSGPGTTSKQNQFRPVTDFQEKNLKSS